MNIILAMALCGSCSCLTKTNEVRYHDELCAYRKLFESRINFEQYLISNGLDSNILAVDSTDNYIDKNTNLLYAVFCEGIKFGRKL